MIRIPYIRFSMLIGLWAMTACFSSAHAQDPTAALGEAYKLMQQGLHVKAIEIIDATLKSNTIESKLAAKAMLMRAEANEKLGRTAFALADYNSAIWMQGLSPSDKAKAETGAKRVTAGLGVSNAAGSGATSSGSQTAQAGTQSPPANEGSSDPFGFFTNLFSTSSNQEQTAAQQPVAAPQPVASNQPAQPAASPQQQPAAAPQRQASVEPQASGEPPAAASAANPTGDFAIQLAALRSEDDAIFEVERLSKRHKAVLAGRLPKVTIHPTQDGGTLYKVVAEPFERGEGTATCELLKTKGTQCMLISK